MAVRDSEKLLVFQTTLHKENKMLLGVFFFLASKIFKQMARSKSL
jgi:hypothetical protein